MYGVWAKVLVNDPGYLIYIRLNNLKIKQGVKVTKLFQVTSIIKNGSLLTYYFGSHFTKKECQQVTTKKDMAY